MAATTEDLLTTDEACAYVGVCRDTLLKMVAATKIKRVTHGTRKLKGRRVPALVRYRRSELDRLIEAQSKQLR